MPKNGPNPASLSDDAAIVDVDRLAELLAELCCGDPTLHRDNAEREMARLREEHDGRTA